MKLGADLSTVTLCGDVAVLKIDSPPVNALGHAVRLALDGGLKTAIADERARAIVILCGGRTFFAGADITEFGKPFQAPDLNQLFQTIEASPKPVVAAIHGTALGGGLELAMACHYRVAVASARLGLPEISLGLLPGAGGTQRAPRLIGVAGALDLIVSGRPVDAAKAQAMGLVDVIVDGDLEAGAVAFADQAAAGGRPPLARDRAPDVVGDAAQTLIADYRAKNAHQFIGFKAPGHILLAIEAATRLPFDEGLSREADLFGELMESGESAAQRHIFFAERAAGKVANLTPDIRPLPVEKVAVIGAGTMGGGIALAFLNAGLGVTLIDRDQAAVDRGAGVIRKTIRGLVEKKRIGADEGAAREARLSVGTDIAEAGQADLIVEAVYEDLGLKTAIFAALDGVAKPGAILASNTSFLDLEVIAAATKRPDAVVGMHFFAPANIMRLLEVVRGRQTSDAVIATAMALGRKLGKVAVLSGVCDGFIANRAMAQRGFAADQLILEGPMPQDIDRVMVKFGFPMGPLAMMDLVGLDVIGWDRENSAGRTVQEVLCEAGRWGQKTGAGYYDYDADRRPTPSETANAVIRRFATADRRFSDEEILERLLYPVVNEGAKILEEGIAARASDIDVALVTGYGWPVYTGGPMFWADAVGLKRIVAGLEATMGAEAISPLLRRLASEGKSLGGA